MIMRPWAMRWFQSCCPCLLWRALRGRVTARTLGIDPRNRMVSANKKSLCGGVIMRFAGRQ